MIRVAILGASGYSALELIKLLLRHPEVEDHGAHHAANRAAAGGRSASVARRPARSALENLSPSQVAERADCVFCCLPHGASAAAVARAVAARQEGDRPQRRLPAQRPGRIRQVVRPRAPRSAADARRPSTACRKSIASESRRASLVANPGCYPTSAILALAPLLRAGAILPRRHHHRQQERRERRRPRAEAAFHFPECNESVSAYGVGTHRHMPEIDQVLTDVAGSEVRVVFTPHLIPMDRGILSTCYAEPTGEFDDKSLLGDPAASSTPTSRSSACRASLPATKHVTGTNFCDITVRSVRGRVIVISAIDNLIKGASGAAVQNFN